MNRQGTFVSSLFLTLVISQILHLGEHVAQMVQIHMLGLQGASARGIVGALDIEWVHFIWNSWVIIGVAALLVAFPGNRWLWVTAVVSGWHELEHCVIMAGFLSTHVAGGPGLLSHGGILGGGLPLSRPDLHFLYNLVEVVPLVTAYLTERRLTAYRAPLARGRRPTAQP